MCEPYWETSYSELCVSDIQKVLRQNNLPDIRFHDLRHSCATMLLSLGFSMKAVQEQLEHTQYATTANTCAHVYDKTKHEIAVTIRLLNVQKRVINQRYPKKVMIVTKCFRIYTLQKIAYSN